MPLYTHTTEDTRVALVRQAEALYGTRPDGAAMLRRAANNVVAAGANRPLLACPPDVWYEAARRIEDDCA